MKKGEKKDKLKYIYSLTKAEPYFMTYKYSKLFRK